MPRRTPTVALLTDFGLSDHFVGVLKGVLLSQLPSVRLIDITHEIEPGRIPQGAFALWATAPYLPEETVVLAVVDPGVGTDRAILVLRTRRLTFVAPDNGLLDMVRGEDARAKCYTPSAATLDRVGGKQSSMTFQGRDIMAPLAAELARGSSPARLGKSRRLPPAPAWKASPADPNVMPAILSMDRFGNLITNIPIPPGRTPRDVIRMVGIGNIMVAQSVRTYAEAPENTPCAIRGSSGLLEVVVRNGSASTLLKAHDRTPVRVVWA